MIDEMSDSDGYDGYYSEGGSEHDFGDAIRGVGFSSGFAIQSDSIHLALPPPGAALPLHPSHAMRLSNELNERSLREAERRRDEAVLSADDRYAASESETESASAGSESPLSRLSQGDEAYHFDDLNGAHELDDLDQRRIEDLDLEDEHSDRSTVRLPYDLGGDLGSDSEQEAGFTPRLHSLAPSEAELSVRRDYSSESDEGRETESEYGLDPEYSPDYDMPAPPMPDYEENCDVQKPPELPAVEEDALQEMWPLGNESFSIFLCPITHDVLRDPVVAADGYTYERLAIARWFKTSRKSPVTGQMLPNKTLFPNQSVRTLMKSLIDRVQGQKQPDSPNNGTGAFAQPLGGAPGAPPPPPEAAACLASQRSHSSASASTGLSTTSSSLMYPAIWPRG